MTPENETKTKFNSLGMIKLFMVKYGLSVSAAIRRYTDIFGLPPTKQSKRFLGTLPDNPDHLGWTGHY